MGLCASKTEKVDEEARSLGVGAERTQQRRGYQREYDGVQKQRFDGLGQGKRNSGEGRQEASASQSTSGATGDRKRSVVSGNSRHSSELTPTVSQFGEGNGVSGGGNRAMKVLLLGSGESGKSTVLQQLKILHQNGFTNEELMEYRPFIFDNIVETGKDLVNARMQFNMPLEEDSELTQDDLNQLLSYTRPSEQAEPFPPDLAHKLSKLWRLPSTQELVKGERRSSFYLMDNAGHFLSSLDRISQPDYRPTIADVLRTRKKTSGIFDTTIEMDSNLKLHIYDVGGQRSERKKWIHCFDNVTLVIFCVSLSEYDQSLMEDKSQNRLEESLILFDSVVNSRWFTRTSVVLFLNKIDSFAEKLQTVPLEKYFPDYTGGPDINKAAKYILWRFVQLNRANLNIYPHVTQATDTSNIKLVFVAIKETILENSLKDSGVL